MWNPFRRAEPQVITAAAEEVHKIKDSAPQRFGSNARQKRAWLHYDMVPEMWFAHNYVANALKRIRIFPATQPDTSQPPIPLGPTDGAIGARSNAEMDRLRDVDGTHGTLIHDSSLQLCVPGEGLFAMYDDPDDGHEVNKVYSLDELIFRDGEWLLLSEEGKYEGKKIGKDIEAGGSVLVNRFYRPHPRFSQQPDSAFFALRKPLDELLILDQLYRSNGRSRVPSGVLLVPSQVGLKEKIKAHVRPGGQGGPDQAKVDPMVAAILKALTQPLSDEESAANVAPPVIKADGDWIEKFRHMMFGREFDANTAARYDRLMKRIADGVDLPAGIVMGAEDLNHWSLWQVDDDAFDSHLAPLVELVCSSMTEVFLQPALADVQTPADEKVFVWYDASALISHPNKSKDALSAHKEMLISDAAGRKHLGYSEDDAPDDEEIERRIEIQKAIKVTTPSGGEAGPPPEPQSRRPSLVASAMPVNELGTELARLDRDLRMQLQGALEGIVQRTVDKAGNKMRAAATHIDAMSVVTGDQRAEIMAASNEHVCQILGRDTVSRFATDEELVDGATESALIAYARLTSRVQRLLRSIAQDYDPDVDLEQLEMRQDADRQRGAEVLATILSALILAKLFSPAADAPAQGELDDFIVAAGDLRDVLAAAGGAPSGTATSAINQTPEGGVATGETAMDIMIRVGLTPDGWEWMYGSSPRAHFAGHLALDGVQFLDWHDEALRVSEADAWLSTDFYHPGDHRGCQCDFAPIMTEDETTTNAAPALVEA